MNIRELHEQKSICGGWALTGLGLGGLLFILHRRLPTQYPKKKYVAYTLLTLGAFSTLAWRGVCKEFRNKSYRLFHRNFPMDQREIWMLQEESDQIAVGFELWKLLERREETNKGLEMILQFIDETALTSADQTWDRTVRFFGVDHRVRIEKKPCSCLEDKAGIIVTFADMAKAQCAAVIEMMVTKTQMKEFELGGESYCDRLAKPVDYGPWRKS